jgi:hypothetical protein
VKGSGRRGMTTTTASPGGRATATLTTKKEEKEEEDACWLPGVGGLATYIAYVPCASVSP